MQNPQTQNSGLPISIPSAADGKRVWLRVGTLIDGESSLPIRNAHIVYDATSILYVAGEANHPPASLLNFGQSLPDLDLPDFTLLPGLIEAHAHIFLEGGELDSERRAANLKKPLASLVEEAGRKLERIARLGVIGVRDAGDRMGVGLALSKSYSRGENPVMPYFDSPGAAIHHKGAYGGFMADPVEDFLSPEECVRSRLRKGADRIKLIVSDVIDFRSGRVIKTPQMSAEEVEKLVAASRENGKQTFAHATGDLGIENAIMGGVDSIEHGFFIRNDQLERMRDREIAWVPTFSPVQKQVEFADRMGWDQKVVSNLRRILDQHSASLLKADKIGVKIIAGSDAGALGVPHGFGLIDELCLMENAGLSSLSVLRSAAGTSSSRLGFKEKFGLIKPGYQSRIILTQHSPVESVLNIKKEKYVIFDGKLLSNEESINLDGL